MKVSNNCEVHERKLTEEEPFGHFWNELYETQLLSKPENDDRYRRKATWYFQYMQVLRMISIFERFCDETLLLWHHL